MNDRKANGYVEERNATQHYVSYKTKVRRLVNADNSESDYINLKRDVKRSDCSLEPHQHTYFNSDLFPAMLNRAVRAVTGERDWLRLSELPVGVTVDTSKFLAVVRIELPESFK